MARLYTDGAFLQRLREQFDGDFTLRFHLAPPLLARRNDKGELVKREYGPWVMGAFRVLARLKGLRGTAFDPFGHTEERRTERALIREYEAAVEEVLRDLRADRLPLALEIARWPARMGMNRSENMRRIRSKNTAPEMAVRRLAHGLGYRYRLHRKDIPGKPDLVFPGRRKVIFIHGCFWHQHPGCREGRPPKSNAAYWLPKLERNIERDKAALAQLAAARWEVLVIWECETKNHEATRQALLDFLGPPHLAGKGQ